MQAFQMELLSTHPDGTPQHQTGPSGSPNIKGQEEERGRQGVVQETTGDPGTPAEGDWAPLQGTLRPSWLAGTHRSGWVALVEELKTGLEHWS